jgi:hypothetical protein
MHPDRLPPNALGTWDTVEPNPGRGSQRNLYATRFWPGCWSTTTRSLRRPQAQVRMLQVTESSLGAGTWSDFEERPPRASAKYGRS